MGKNKSRTADVAAANSYSQYNNSKAEEKTGKNYNLKDAKQLGTGKTTFDIKLDRGIMNESKDDIFLREKLQEAVLWTEILGKPLSKRRKSR